MAENHTRCRFWPNCRLHLGHERPRYFTTDNRDEMAELHDNGWALAEIAEAFECTPSTVTKMINDRKAARERR